ncbi:protocadherin-8 [Engraulis encrasicolus]|uniref:protocadherin-8 n=1 Tax=Engraulis encrasicolus TaxID=184585 RepID=UPI002FD39F7F
MAFLVKSLTLGLYISLVHCTTTKYFTYEEDAPGTEIGNLSRDLQIDPDEDPNTSFRFMQDPDSSLIQMRQVDGLLTVGETIDREQLCQQSPRCLITFDVVTFSKEKFQLIHVEIEVKDINDNSPQFPANETVLEILENAPLDSRFPLDIAVDKDVGNNYIQSYQVSHNSHFGIEVRTKEDGVKFAELVLVKRLDREIEDSYTVEVTASDGGAPPRKGTVKVEIKVLDFNDNSPTFEHNSLKVELYEDSPVGFRVLKVHAFDPDAGLNGQVFYGFVEGTSAEIMRVFEVDQHSGSVTLKEMVDFEKKRSYEINIKASDLGANPVPSTCRVIVEILDVNDNAPEISIQPMTSASDGVAFITESAAKESFVALLSTSDRDSGSNGYVRSSLHGHHHFKLQQAYGDNQMIVTATMLDRETIPEYNITVEAEDFGSPPFKTVKHYTIRVTDENDNAPLFNSSLYEVFISENNIPGSFITTVVATDIDIGKNSKVAYKLVESHALDGDPITTFVSIDPVSGSLYTLRSFDFETVKQTELTVEASDGGVPSLSSTCVVRIYVIDQNDNYPYITYPDIQNDTTEVQIPFNAPAGYVILHVKAEDEDDGENSKLSYELSEGDRKMFSVDKNTGQVSLKQKVSCSSDEGMDVKIRVSDSGIPSLFTEASIQFVISETQDFHEQYVIAVEDEREDNAHVDVSSTVMALVGAGCTLLLVASVSLTLFCKFQQKTRDYASKSDRKHGLFGTTSLTVYNASEANIYGGTARFLNHGKKPVHDDSCVYEDKTTDSESKIFGASRSFDGTTLWQDDKFNFQRSGTGNTDQQSVKDSGKGDSDFNDSDSDISGEGLRRTLSTFQPWAKNSFHSSNALAVDWQSSYCVIPTTHSLHAAPGNAYTIGFSHAAAYSNTHVNPQSWKESCYNTNIPKADGSAQTFCGTGVLLAPPHSSSHHHQTRDLGAKAEDQREPAQDFLTVTTLSEIATTF